MTRRILIEAEKYRPFVYAAAQNSGIFKPSVLIGVMCEESHCGLLLTPRGPAGVGDNGHGRGLMQIDDRYHEFARTGPWQDPMENIMFGTKLLTDNYEFFQHEECCPEFQKLTAALAAYNCGPAKVERALRRRLGVDYYTSRDGDSGAHGDYSADVMVNAQYFLEHGWI